MLERLVVVVPNDHRKGRTYGTSGACDMLFKPSGYEDKVTFNGRFSENYVSFEAGFVKDYQGFSNNARLCADLELALRRKDDYQSNIYSVTLMGYTKSM